MRFHHLGVREDKASMLQTAFGFPAAFELSRGRRGRGCGQHVLACPEDSLLHLCYIPFCSMPKVGQVVVYFKSSPFKGMQLQNQGGENFHCLVKCFPVFNWVPAEEVFSFLMLDCTWKGRSGPDFPTSSCSSPAEVPHRRGKTQAAMLKWVLP